MVKKLLRGLPVNKVRFALARLRRGTVRFYTGDLGGFYQAMHAADIAYVVLRWSHLLPMDSKAETSYGEDVDHLIADDQIRKILKIASHHPGPVKCDYYSASGQSGTSYKGVPYYMPALAEQLLNGRQLDPRGFYRPAPRDEVYGFAYHLCYHKGHRCGLSGGEGIDLPIASPSKDYAEELRKLASVAGGIALPEPLNLLTLHEFLKAKGWNMPVDLMVRWPDQHPFLTALQAHENSKVAPHVAAARDLTTFVLRADCDTPELEQLAQQMIEERFQVLDVIRLSAEQQQRLIRQTRGGDWVEKYCKAVVPPTVALICRNAEVPGPLPIAMSPDKLNKRYPHVTNTDVLIKRNIRDAVREAANPSSQNRVVLHATDNAHECVETMAAIFDDDLDAALLRYGTK